MPEALATVDLDASTEPDEASLTPWLMQDVGGHLQVVPDAPDWQAEAACASEDVDPAIFFPSRGDPAFEARRVCAGCPVRDECLEWAVADPDLDAHGILGGLNPRQRARYAATGLRPAPSADGTPGRPPSPCGTDAAYRRHRRRDETCETCEQAHEARKAEARRQRLRERPAPPCGTPKAYERHRKLDETCETCDQAKRENRRRGARKAAAGRPVVERDCACPAECCPAGCADRITRRKMSDRCRSRMRRLNPGRDVDPTCRCTRSCCPDGCTDEVGEGRFSVRCRVRMHRNPERREDDVT